MDLSELGSALVDRKCTPHRLTESLRLHSRYPPYGHIRTGEDQRQAVLSIGAWGYHIPLSFPVNCKFK